MRCEGLPDGARLIVDGLAFSPLLDAFAAEAERLPIYALVHHPLCDETGLAPKQRTKLFERERQALALAHGVVVTSRHTAARLADFGVPRTGSAWSDPASRPPAAVPRLRSHGPDCSAWPA